MPHPQPIITFVSSLDWPDDDAEVEEAVIQCAGKSYLAYESRLLDRRGFLHGSSFRSTADGGPSSSSSSMPVDGDDDDDDDGNDGGRKKKLSGKKEYDLLTMSDRKLKKLNYYQVLSRSLPMHANSDEVRRAYHKACLRYHPDKTGRDEEDEVFLLVKAAFDTLSDPMKRRSYDSTVDFDESIPKEGVSESDFYAEYGPVFERNLRFASCNDPMNQVGPGGGGDGAGPPARRGKSGGKKKAQTTTASASSGPPEFGDDSTPLSQVHAFYDFWIHFDSWRDFTLRASKETEHDVDAADSRDEKRWMKQEIERKVKKMKKDEMARINLLVERAMAADPRLRREKERLVREKREREEEKRKVEEERATRERIEREVREKETAARRAKIKEAEKKQLRKARQLFRKLTMAAYQSMNPNDSSETGNDAVWDDLEKMNDDIELLSEKLSVTELTSLNDLLGGPEAAEEGSSAPVHVGALIEVRQCAVETAAGAERQSLVAVQRRNEARKEAADRAREARLSRASVPWSREELGALAKAVKKYPPGGSNRWDAIALFVNNLCKQPDPRTKEECIEKYNSIASAAAAPSSSSSTAVADGGAGGSAVESSAAAAEEGAPWNEEQDALLQEMLRKYPADMEKNERWKMIARGVPGRTKKECVERFKAIREAVKQGKK
ncbi:hypothetical protein ACHAW5_000230 [Stephanodiscus triporus]|uniref:DnaJ homolog subfamily C member 2 n=1 Tax=Stephanodiscus triporus TaxID=2934178 RepID=A0ABD3QPJ9_9STRA